MVSHLALTGRRSSRSPSSGGSGNVLSATQLTVTTQPSGTATSGTALAQQPVVQLQDATGAAVNLAGATITASIHSGSSTLSGTTSVNTDGTGKATFTDLVYTTASTSSMHFAVNLNGITAVDSSSTVVGASGGAAADLEVNFDDTATNTVSKLLASDARSNGLLLSEGQAATGDLSIVSQPYGGYTNALQFHYPSGSGSDTTIEPGFVFLWSSIAGITNPRSGSGKGQKELWIEAGRRFNAGFTTLGSAAGGDDSKCCICGDYWGGSSRWNMPEMSSTRFVGGPPGQESTYIDNTFTPSTDLWDNVSRQWRWHLKLSSTPGVTADAILRLKIDGVYAMNITTGTSAADNTEISVFRFFANLNKGVTAGNNDCIHYYHYVKIWKGSNNPGWGW